jgi:8-oxo-dGTP pyrophosphatase MutT (NUDIX family)
MTDHRGPAADPGLFERKEEFLDRVIERLGRHPSDFSESMRGINASGKNGASRLAAGVLLPLGFRIPTAGRRPEETGFHFRLIKRSASVPQPGDLSCPGGMLHPLLDRLLRPLLIDGPFPIVRGRVRRYAADREPETCRTISLFLTNALRESWEEIRLSPRSVSFLGPLPTYSLVLFRRTIFPLAGFVESGARLHPNREVEKIVDIPLSSFYRAGAIGCFILSADHPSAAAGGEIRRFPCLIHREEEGGEEILWGATFHIIVRFLEIVMDYRLPAWEEGRVVRRTLDAEYLTGRPAP